MMFDVRSAFHENLIFFVLAAFVFMSMFGVGMGMETQGGRISSCPFMAGEASLCQMSTTEHIGQWQKTLLGIPAKSNGLLLASLFPFLIVISFVKPLSRVKQLETTKQLLYVRDARNTIFDPFLLAFSDGILNPKIYEPARM